MKVLGNKKYYHIDYYKSINSNENLSLSKTLPQRFLQVYNSNENPTLTTILPQKLL